MKEILPAETILQQLRQLQNGAENLKNRAEELGDQLQKFQVSTEGLVRIEFDNAGIPVFMEIMEKACDATPSLIEAAVSKEIVSGYQKRNPITENDLKNTFLARAITQGDIPRPETITGIDGIVSIDLLVGRPVRVHIRSEFALFSRKAEVCQAVIETCSGALACPHDEKEKWNGQSR